MICVLAYSQKDYPLAVRLSQWIEMLGGVQNHDCILTIGRKAVAQGVIEPLQRAFKSVTVNVPYDDEDGWPQGPNLLWKRTVEFISIGKHGLFKRDPAPFLWMEPDATPLRSTWLDDIEKAYQDSVKHKKPFLGQLVDVAGSSKHLSGIAVYPPNITDFTENFINLHNTAWDMFFANDFLPHAMFTNLIHHCFWKSTNPDVAPTFPDIASLDFIHPEARVFHRCKDGTLIDRLIEKRGKQETSKSISHPTLLEGAFQKIKESIDFKPEKTIHTYYAPVSEISTTDAGKMIDLWCAAWKEKGWTPVILGEDDAKKHPLYNAAKMMFEKFPTVNPKGYEFSCWMRWLAMANVGGFMADYDVLPINPELKVIGDMTIYSSNERDPLIPCLVHGTKQSYQDVVMYFMSLPTNGKHMSDMTSLAGKSGTIAISKQVAEYGEPDWKSASAVHFSHHSMGDKRPKWKHIPKLMQEIVGTASVEKQPVIEPPKTIADQMREHIAKLEEIIDGKQGRLISFQTELRKRKLIPQARKR